MMYERAVWIILLMTVLFASMIVYTYYLVYGDYVMSSIMVVVMSIAFYSLYRELSYVFKVIDREIEFIENYMFKGDRR